MKYVIYDIFKNCKDGYEIAPFTFDYTLMEVKWVHFIVLNL